MQGDPRSREFVYGLDTAAEITTNARRLLDEGLHVILNETVDVADGGVSGTQITVASVRALAGSPAA